MPLPKIVIVGRPNVGKSSLLNRLAQRRISIVDPTAGVTRDRIATTITIQPGDHDNFEEPHHATLIDTGGYGIVDRQDLNLDIEQQIAQGLGEADVVLFIVDAQSGIATLDETVARVIRTSAGAGDQRKPVILVSNKVDAENHEAAAYDAMRLGFGEPIMVSANTGYGLSTLHTAIRESIDFDKFDEDEAEIDEGILVALVGKRNAGKSTLTNALVGEERVIVSEKEGTTRDSVDVRIEMAGETYTLIDTAGVRKTKSLDGDIEFYSQHRSLRSVRRADVCLLLIDAAVPISQVDHQLVNEITKHHRPTVVVVNKWDLAEADYTQEEYVAYLDDSLKGLSFAPIVFISALKGEGMTEAISMARNLHAQSHHRMGTSELNRGIEEIAAERGPSNKHGKHAKIYYATQVGTAPPTVALFVNDADLFNPNWQQYLVGRMRDYVAFSEVPIRIKIKGKDKLTAEERKAFSGRGT